MNTLAIRARFKRTSLFTIASIMAFSAVATVLPFILAPSAGAVSTVNTANLSTWDLTSTRVNGHNELTTNGLHIWTDGSSDTGPRTDGVVGTWNTDKAAGYLNIDPVPLADIGTPSIEYASSTGSKPGLQLTVDLAGNGGFDGYLVVEDAFTPDWWLSASSVNAKLVAPKDLSQPSYRQYWGTQGQFTSAFTTAYPNARITQVGYSLGSGAQGDATISKITLGDTSYTFSQPLSVPQFTTPANDSLYNNGDFGISWTAIDGATSYVTRSSASSDTDSNGVLIDNGTDAFIELPWDTNSLSNLNLPEGTFYWQVKAKNASQDSGWSSIIKVTIDKTPPAVSLDSVSDDTDTPTLSGTTSADAQYVFVTIGDTTTQVAVAGGTWSYTVPDPLGEGDYGINVVAQDFAGNQSVEPATGVLTIAAAQPVTSTPVTTDTSTTTTTTTAAETPALVATVVPSIVSPTAFAGVLGDSTTTPSTGTTDNNTGVKGATSTKDVVAAAANSEANKGTFLGFGWYWWVLIIGVVTIIAWLIAAAAHRRKTQS